jgi:hypothetical protein
MWRRRVTLRPSGKGGFTNGDQPRNRDVSPVFSREFIGGILFEPPESNIPAMRILLLQLNPVIGDLAGNAEAVRREVVSAGRDAADLIVTPELALLGYPPPGPPPLQELY